MNVIGHDGTGMHIGFPAVPVETSIERDLASGLGKVEVLGTKNDVVTVAGFLNVGKIAASQVFLAHRLEAGATPQG